MGVTVIDPGRLVLVEPDGLDAKDVLELAGAIIEEQGWSKGSSGGSSLEGGAGWSIHGAVGEAARRAKGVSDKSSDAARPLRDEAKALIESAYAAAHPGEPVKTEFQINDDAADVTEALAAIDAARGRTVAA